MRSNCNRGVSMRTVSGLSIQVYWPESVSFQQKPQQMSNTSKGPAAEERAKRASHTAAKRDREGGAATGAEGAGVVTAASRAESASGPCEEISIPRLWHAATAKAAS
jgi:hypothetical protein